ncbi:GNAT family N-acetyltransferase [Aquabacterium sp. OR-4]|uniref:GNAT family N-acetyltransferase n=1 Tax=Aquabacterium sp. OR-4 TaxID=2978127 RepID=UPI0028C98ACB|nr:GNAT family N-acetyltransferase [Aquabacterium sp. OR-4]MDT7837687.1 GNAT family N-acetyltransferase [Aquabacterium sp. OR-4]
MSIRAVDMAYQTEVVATAAQVDAVEWRSLWPSEQEGRDYYMVQDQAGLPGFEFGYLLLRRAGRLVMIAPLYVADFDFRLAFEGKAQQRLARMQRVWPGLMVWRTLFCGGFATERSVIAVAADVAADPALWRAFDAALCAHARQKRARMIVMKDFAADDSDASLASLRVLGYSRSDALPMPVIDLPYKSLDEYLESLSTGTRKDLRRKQKQTNSRGGLIVEARQTIDPPLAQALHGLYRQVYNRSDLHFETLTPAYFEGFGRLQPEHSVYFLYFSGQNDSRQLIGFNLCTVHDGRLMDKYIGMDYSQAHQYNLYFVSFLYNVQWCIEHGLKAYVLNQGGYELKAKFGATMHPLMHMTRMVNPILNSLQARFT